MLRALILSLAIAGVTAACASAPQELPRASAVPETVRVEMPVDPRDNGLTQAQLELIEALAGEYKARGHGPFVISYPQNAGNADAALGAIADVRNALHGHGLDWRQITGGAYEAGGYVSAPVIFPSPATVPLHPNVTIAGGTSATPGRAAAGAASAVPPSRTWRR